MALKSLNQLLALRRFVEKLQRVALLWRYGIVVPPGTTISLSSRLRPANRGSITIGEDTLIAFKTLLYTRDLVTGDDRPIHIGRRCFIGGGSMILPGVTIGDGSIVAAGATVSEDVPPGSIVGGTPARIIRSGITVGLRGRLAQADENSRRLWNVPERD